MHIFQVSESVWRGPRPTTIDDVLELKERGFQTILNLERGWFEFLHGEMNVETKRCLTVGLSPVNIHLGIYAPPTLPELTASLIVLTDPKFGKVYVHCKHGVDRTGMVIAAYRMMAQRWSFGKAKEEMLAMGFHNWAYFWWISQLKNL